MAQAESPVVQQRRLRAELRRVRDQTGLTQKDVADALDWSSSKLIRIETGAVGISTTDLTALLHHYGISDRKRVDELVQMARASRKQAWWDEYRGVFGQQFLNFLGYEASATRIRQYQALLIPGLLQTREYSEAVLRVFSSSLEDVSRGVEVRAKRQALHDQQTPPEMFFVLDEAVIRRLVGGPEVMRRQLLRLVELDRRPHVNIQVVPFSAGAHSGMKGSFTIFEFPFETDDYVVTLHQTHGDVIVQNDAAQTSTYVETFYELEDIAAPKGQLQTIVDEVLATLPDGDPATAEAPSE